MVSLSRTYEVAIDVLYENWSEEKLHTQWLKEKIVVRKATVDKSMRITWSDGTHVDVCFYEKGAVKSQSTVQRSKLGNSAQVERMKSPWKAALERLSVAL